HYTIVLSADMERVKQFLSSPALWKIVRLLWSPSGQVAIGVVFSLGLGWLAVRGIKWSLVGQSFQDFSWWYAIMALGLFLLSLFLRAYRWQVLFVTERVSLFRLFLVQNTGIGLNNLSPVRVVSEPSQFAMLTLRYKVRGGVAAATLGMERVLDLVASTAVFATGLIFIPAPARGAFWWPVLVAFVLSSMAVLIFYLLGVASRKTFTGRLAFANSFLQSVARLERAKALLAYSLFLSVVYWFMVGVCAWLLSEGMGLGISPLISTLAIMSTLYFATVVPAMPGAVGTFEFAIVYFLGQFYGVGQAMAFSYALAVHALLFLPPTVIAILVIVTIGLTPRKGRQRALPKAEEVAPAPNTSVPGPMDGPDASKGD
ncbi:MAG: lysylphosphatidylglycerol synthase transmembrane domain-containing protein, partial [Chloroflexota bacterium]|nr:lysylphosphatidylglycerol synthase transmembrane domain-containing protein [Chloroflexota bacterium]